MPNNTIEYDLASGDPIPPAWVTDMGTYSYPDESEDPPKADPKLVADAKGVYICVHEYDTTIRFSKVGWGGSGERTPELFRQCRCPYQIIQAVVTLSS